MSANDSVTESNKAVEPVRIDYSQVIDTQNQIICNLEKRLNSLIWLTEFVRDSYVPNNVNAVKLINDTLISVGYQPVERP